MHDPPRILIVDDNETNRDILATRLATQGYDLCQAADGEWFREAEERRGSRSPADGGTHEFASLSKGFRGTGIRSVRPSIRSR
jgi:response regulator RpfG family c-di-GMP phosphodiesterase